MLTTSIRLRSFLSHRLWLHPRARPEAFCAYDETLQRNGRRHGRRFVGALRLLQAVLLHSIHHFAQILQSHPEPVRADGRRQHSRHQARTR